MKNYVIAPIVRTPIRPKKWMSFEPTYQSLMKGQDLKNWYFECYHCSFGSTSTLTQSRHQYFEMVWNIIRYNLNIQILQTKEHFIFHDDASFFGYDAMLNDNRPEKRGRSKKKGTRGRPPKEGYK